MDKRGQVESICVEGSPITGLGCPTYSSAVVVPAVMADFSIFSGSPSNKASDSEAVVGVLSVKTEDNERIRVVSEGVVDKSSILVGAAILNPVWDESSAEISDVTYKDGGFGVDVRRGGDKPKFVVQNVCNIHGVGGCYSCGGAVLDPDVELSEVVADGVVVGSNGGIAPNYRSVRVPNIVNKMQWKGQDYARPCGLQCGNCHELGGLNTQLNPCVFFDECFNHPGGVDDKAVYLFTGVRDGFKIVDEGYSESYERSNYSSIIKPEAKRKMDKLVRKEMEEGVVYRVKDKPQCVHSLGAIYKQDGSIRPITDCSRGKRGLGEDSINDHMKDTCEKFAYVKVDKIVDEMREKSWFSVVDIQSAYRAVSVDPQDRGKQGFVWELDGEKSYWVDSALAFGLKCAPFIFQQITEFVIRCLSRRGIGGVYGYLDDYLVVADSQEECRSKQAVLLDLLRRLGFHIAWKKVVAPNQVVRYLGLEFDSIKMEIRLPSDKVKKTMEMVKDFRGKKCCSRKELQSLAGYLAHASQVVRGGRTFSRRIINLIKYIPEDGKVVHIPEWLEGDLTWWKNFIEIFNGKARWIQVYSKEIPQVETDSSKSGFGARWGEDWVAGVFDEKRDEESKVFLEHHYAKTPGEVDEKYDINLLELWPVLATLDRWGETWRNHKVVIWTDNTQVQSMIATGRSKSIRAMWWLRELFWRVCLYNVHLVSKRISTKENTVADYISRLFDKKNKGTLPPTFSSPLCCFQVTD